MYKEGGLCTVGELVHVIIEAEKSLYLPYASLEAQQSQWCSPSPSPKAQEPGAPMSLGRRRWGFQFKMRVNFPFLCLFVLFWLSVDWMKPLALVRVSFFTRFTNSNANLSWEHLHWHIQKCFYQLSGHLLTQLN